MRNKFCCTFFKLSPFFEHNEFSSTLGTVSCLFRRQTTQNANALLAIFGICRFSKTNNFAKFTETNTNMKVLLKRVRHMKMACHLGRLFLCNMCLISVVYFGMETCQMVDVLWGPLAPAPLIWQNSNSHFYFFHSVSQPNVSDGSQQIRPKIE